MGYSVRCECGKVYQVSAGLCGTTWKCTCGRALTILSLTELRALAGEQMLSPEVVIETMLRAKQLPEDKLCVRCRAITDNVCHVRTICEGVAVQPDRGGWSA